jgi:hypothetical protein
LCPMGIRMCDYCIYVGLGEIPCSPLAGYCFIQLFLRTCTPRERSGCSDSLRAGRSTDQRPVGARFFERLQTVPEVHSAFYKMSTGFLSQVLSGRGVASNTPLPHLTPKLK